MKYFLFDLSVLACVIAVARNFVRDRGVSILSQVCDASGGTANQIPIEKKRPETERVPRHPRNDFKVGDIVQVNELEIDPSYAFYAEILRVNRRDDGSSTYKVRTLLARSPEIFHGVQSSSLRLYKRPHRVGTRMMCTYGRSIDASTLLAPCTILSHYGDGAETTYYVLENLDGELNYRKIPLARIRPIAKMTSYLRGVFETLPPLDPPIDVGGNEGNPLLGGVLEFNGPERNFDSPLIITSHNDDGTIDVHYTFHDRPMTEVKTGAVRAYSIYEDGTEALCKVERSGRVHAVPCTVISHRITKAGALLYQVWLSEEDDKMFGDELPLTRVHRRRGNGNASYVWD